MQKHEFVDVSFGRCPMLISVTSKTQSYSNHNYYAIDCSSQNVKYLRIGFAKLVHLLDAGWGSTHGTEFKMAVNE
jgi:hypothetical protein